MPRSRHDTLTSGPVAEAPRQRHHAVGVRAAIAAAALFLGGVAAASVTNADRPAAATGRVSTLTSGADTTAVPDLDALRIPRSLPRARRPARQPTADTTDDDSNTRPSTPAVAPASSAAPSTQEAAATPAPSTPPRRSSSTPQDTSADVGGGIR